MRDRIVGGGYSGCTRATCKELQDATPAPLKSLPPSTLLFISGPILEVMQYEADPWTGLSKLTAPVLLGKIQIHSRPCNIHSHELRLNCGQLARHFPVTGTVHLPHLCPLFFYLPVPDSVLNSSAIFHLTLSALQPHRPGTLKNDVSATLITAAVFYVGLESTVILDFGRAAIAMHVRTFSRQTGVEATLNLLSSAL
ncbi:Neutral amino acid transporter excitatory amino acid transporter [Echinococcus multilocularis]|uniref:Neutral amino acid transporter excitatory amino acid transporter n=1 Tax=Echinococcus multilocularis TaxID=6211 RepID=A0A0S4MI47_ECHMU|nr:Neutral amino acid transporter excitatory amino acid transporter [Echinococcus multilocularis]